ncbi:hypothetical protein XENOCAPTIV_007808 [Xenoophorus captivus]|uniref:Ig-like domain-containing protein n=1 Tax=Xenoophorus captivus TaxID=1517983 RepID=A0ABV0S8U8_9TELE
MIESLPAVKSRFRAGSNWSAFTPLRLYFSTSSLITNVHKVLEHHDGSKHFIRGVNSSHILVVFTDSCEYRDGDSPVLLTCLLPVLNHVLAVDWVNTGAEGDLGSVLLIDKKKVTIPDPSDAAPRSLSVCLWVSHVEVTQNEPKTVERELDTRGCLGKNLEEVGGASSGSSCVFQGSCGGAVILFLSSCILPHVLSPAQGQIEVRLWMPPLRTAAEDSAASSALSAGFWHLLLFEMNEKDPYEWNRTGQVVYRTSGSITKCPARAVRATGVCLNKCF